MTDDEHTQTPAHTLDRIREGGQQVILVAMERLRDCEKALQEGRFCDAYARARELEARLTALAHAEGHLGSVAATWILRASDIEEGMVLQSWGTVATKEIVNVPNPGGPPHTHVKLTFDDDGPEPVELHAETEVVALQHGD